MKYQNVVAFLIIPLAFLSILSLLDNVYAQQTNSSGGKIVQPQQQNQNMNMTAQALMKTDIFELKDTLEKAKLAIVDGNLKGALKDVRDVETQLLLIETSPTKFLSNIHKAINAIARSEVDKSLDTLTNIQVTILKAENEIFKAGVTNPQLIQQSDTRETNSDDEDSKYTEDDSKDAKQQFDTIIDEKEYYTNVEDT